VAKTLVDIPEAKLTEAMSHLGARSKREAVEMALDRVNQQARQTRLILHLAAGGSPDFTPDVVDRLRGKKRSTRDAVPS